MSELGVGVEDSLDWKWQENAVSQTADGDSNRER